MLIYLAAFIGVEKNVTLMQSCHELFIFSRWCPEWMVLLICYKMDAMLSLLEFLRKMMAPPSGYWRVWTNYYCFSLEQCLMHTVFNISWWHTSFKSRPTSDEQDHLTKVLKRFTTHSLLSTEVWLRTVCFILTKKRNFQFQNASMITK